MSEPTDLQMGDWMLKVRVPEGDGPHPVIFLIHGWTGDERSMWIFAPRLPKEALLIAPRAPCISKHEQYGGYSWVQERADHFSGMDDFAPAHQSFNALLGQLADGLPGAFERFAMAGFSQGAAFSYSYALKHPERIERLAGLAGFLPEGCEPEIDARALEGKPVYIAHGTQDERVPVEQAHRARDLLEKAGAEVSYCEDDVGHKLGADCFRRLRDFFA